MQAETWVFSRRFRGYDTQEVDDYLVRVAQHAQLLEERAIAAERSLEERDGELVETRRRLGEEGVAGRLAQILALAQDEAAEIRERAHGEERAITERASANAEQMLKDAAEERRTLQRQLEEISATRDRLLNDLRSLSAQIAQAAQQHETGASKLGFGQEQPAVFDAEATESLSPTEGLLEANDDTQAAIATRNGSDAGSEG
jgi:DivIVA domain-containing protein